MRDLALEDDPRDFVTAGDADAVPPLYPDMISIAGDAERERSESSDDSDLGQ